MFGMYVYNIYQNILSCRQFYRNTTRINTNIKNIREHLKITRNKISNFIIKIDKLKSYQKYKNYLQEKLENVDEVYKNLSRFHPLVFILRK